MKNCKSILGSIGGSVVITLITGLYNGTSGGLVGAVTYGFPLAWLRRLVIAPQYFPWRVIIPGLIVDLVIWFLVIEILYVGAKSLEMGKTKKAAPKSKRKR
jgi:hypothetical protein